MNFFMVTILAYTDDAGAKGRAKIGEPTRNCSPLTSNSCPAMGRTSPYLSAGRRMYKRALGGKRINPLPRGAPLISSMLNQAALCNAGTHREIAAYNA